MALQTMVDLKQGIRHNARPSTKSGAHRQRRSSRSPTTTALPHKGISQPIIAPPAGIDRSADHGFAFFFSLQQLYYPYDPALTWSAECARTGLLIRHKRTVSSMACDSTTLPAQVHHACKRFHRRFELGVHGRARARRSIDQIGPVKWART